MQPRVDLAVRKIWSTALTAKMTYYCTRANATVDAHLKLMNPVATVMIAICSVQVVKQEVNAPRVKYPISNMENNAFPSARVIL